MDASERYEITMLSAPDFQSNDRSSSTGRAFSIRTRSASTSLPTNSLDSSENEQNLVGFIGPLHERRAPLAQISGPFTFNHNREFIFEPPQSALRQRNGDPSIERYHSMDQTKTRELQLDDSGGKYEHLLRSGQLGKCHDPYCRTCPVFYNVQWHQEQSRGAVVSDSKFYKMIYEDAKGWAKRMCSFLNPCRPGVINPHAKVVQQWNKFFVISCLFAVFLDTLFVLSLSMQQENKCIALDWPLATTIALLRSLTDIVYLVNVFLQFRLAYVAPESRVAGSGDLVDDPKRIARRYLFKYFAIDFFIVLPLPLILTLLIFADSTGAFGTKYAKEYLLIGVLIQCIYRLLRIIHLACVLSPSSSVLFGFIFHGHLFGTGWYQHCLERVNQCFQDACHESNITNCMEFIYCGHGNYYGMSSNYETWELWKKNENATACLGDDDFALGICKTAANLVTHESAVTRYIYSLFWGLQQISTFAGNLLPRHSVTEILYTMAIMATGLSYFIVFFGHVQNFRLAFQRSWVEMRLRHRNVEQWMDHRHLPEELRRQVRDSERFAWAATRGINEEMLIENFPEDLQREIRLHLFKSVEKFPIFQLLDEPLINAICERLRTKAYFEGSKVLFRGGLVDKVVFIIRGKMESIGENGIAVPLSEGDVCGEELFTWCLKQYKEGRRIRTPGHKLLSNRLVRCLTNVEAFVLRAADLEEVATLFPRFLRIPQVRGAIRFESPNRRGFPARRVQVAWRYRKKRRNGADSSRPPRN